MSEFLTQLFGLHDQTAVVIGATGVLGGAIAEGIAAAGAHVVVAGRSKERGEDCVGRITEAGNSASFHAVDVGSRESISQLCTDVVASHGKVDILVNCAGVNAASSYDEVKDEDWERILNGNLTATHLGCQIFGEQMAKQGGGAILNIGSVTAHLPLSRVFAYSASKAAVCNLTKNVARELAPKGIRVNVLCPGFFPAEQNRKILTKERTEMIMSGTPMDRFGEPHELVGASILLLAKNAGSFITGAEFYVDGGFTGMRF